jgi:hypothetical protein
MAEVEEPDLCAGIRVWRAASAPIRSAKAIWTRASQSAGAANGSAGGHLGDEARPEVDRVSLTHYGPNAFVQRRETSAQSSLQSWLETY